MTGKRNMPIIIPWFITICITFGLTAQAELILPPVEVSDQSEQPVTPQIDTSEPADIEQRRLTRFGSKPPPNVVSRQENLVFYPCSQCHKYWKTNAVPHELAPVHRVGLNHGNDRFWCLTCHDADDRDRLRTERDGKVEFDESWRVCGQCHAQRQRDWYFGAHGKRVNGWREEAVRYNCTHCHDPHFPPFGKHQPQPKPLVRTGLQPMKETRREHQPIWERLEAEKQEARDD